MIELMVATAIMAAIVTALCGMYIAISDEWQRQSGQSDALFAASMGSLRIGEYASQGVKYSTMKRPGSANDDVLAVCIPADSAYGIYVPTGASGDLKYQDGTWVVFYLSDSTGSYSNTGNILWAATAPSQGDIPDHMVPDSSWSLYSNGAGRIAPVSAISFADGHLDYAAVVITVASTYKLRSGQKQVQMSKTVSLRNINP